MGQLSLTYTDLPRFSRAFHSSVRAVCQMAHSADTQFPYTLHKELPLSTGFTQQKSLFMRLAATIRFLFGSGRRGKRL